MNVTAQKFQSLCEPVSKPSARRNHRTTLPQSRIRSTAPSEREPGLGLYHSTYHSETARLRAIFIAPTKLKNRFLLPFIGVHSLSLAFARQLPQRGSRDAGCTIQRTARKPQDCGRFSSPLRKAGAIHRAARKAGDCGRFSSPLRNSEYLTAQKLPVSTGETIPGGAGHPRMGTNSKRN